MRSRSESRTFWSSAHYVPSVVFGNRASLQEKLIRQSSTAASPLASTAASPLPSTAASPLPDGPRTASAVQPAYGRRDLFDLMTSAPATDGKRGRIPTLRHLSATRRSARPGTGSSSSRSSRDSVSGPTNVTSGRRTPAPSSTSSSSPVRDGWGSKSSVRWRRARRTPCTPPCATSPSNHRM